MTIQNDLLLKAAQGKPVERVPVWLMRQAGRILPEYRAIRNNLSGFKELVTTPDLVAEVTIQPVDILDVDAAIIFSDILVIPEAMGLTYEMEEGRGPYFPRKIETPKDIEQMRIVNAEEDLFYVGESIQITKKELHNRVPLIGFAGAPWTIFAYMIEGGGSKTFSKARRFLYQFPNESHNLLDKIASSTVNYLKFQIAAGADIVQIFDSWAGILPAGQYEEFGLAYIRKICNEIDDVPKIVFAKDAYNARPAMNSVSCDVVGLDWAMKPQESRELIGGTKTLQGNLDPCVLYASHDLIINETKKMVDQFGKDRYIANLGHGVYPDIDFNKVKVFVETVKEYSSNL